MQFPPAPPTVTNTYVAPTQSGYNQNTNNGNRGRYNNHQGGHGRGGNNQESNQRSNPAHPIKHYENWFYCFSCGFDAPHESSGCTRQKMGHIATLTRDQKIADMSKPPNMQQFTNASHAGHHKRFLPSQAAATANGYPQYQRNQSNHPLWKD
jgi:hypothetical protein